MARIITVSGNIHNVIESVETVSTLIEEINAIGGVIIGLNLKGPDSNIDYPITFIIRNIESYS